MKTITPEELREVLDKHGKWLREEEGGERANLSGSDLRYSNLSYSDLRYSNLSGSNLSGSDLSRSDLRGSDLSRSHLSGSNLSGSDLSGSNLRGSDLSRSNLSGSDLRYSNLSGSNLSGSDLSRSNLSYWILPEEGSFTAWKSVRSLADKRPIVLKLRIADGTERACCYTSRKCRVAACTPVEAFEKNGEECKETEFCSDHDSAFFYRLNEEARAPELDADPRVECGAGLHIWITRKEAEEWL